MQNQSIYYYSQQNPPVFALNCYLNSNRNNLQNHPLWDFNINSKLQTFSSQANRKNHQTNQLQTPLRVSETNYLKKRQPKKMLNETVDYKRSKSLYSEKKQQQYQKDLTNKIAQDLFEQSKHKECVKHSKPFQSYIKPKFNKKLISELVEPKQYQESCEEEEHYIQKQFKHKWSTNSKPRKMKTYSLDRGAYQDKKLDWSLLREDIELYNKPDLRLFNRSTKVHDWDKFLGDDVSLNIKNQIRR